MCMFRLDSPHLSEASSSTHIHFYDLPYILAGETAPVDFSLSTHRTPEINKKNPGAPGSTHPNDDNTFNAVPGALDGDSALLNPTSTHARSFRVCSVWPRLKSIHTHIWAGGRAQPQCCVTCSRVCTFASRIPLTNDTAKAHRVECDSVDGFRAQSPRK